MATVVRSIGHEDRLSIIEHLDELRTRLIVSVAVIVVAFTVCAWQNNALLNFIGKPLSTQTKHRTEQGKGPLGEIFVAQRGVRATLIGQVSILQTLATDPSLPRGTHTQFVAQLSQSRRLLAGLPKAPPTTKPITLGLAEPFTQTLSIAAYFALLFSLPFLLYQLYAFILPAFSPNERRVALPLMGMVPFLFIAGVAFAYFVVLPAATKFLQNFNADNFNVLVQAKDYYKFAILTLVSVGLVFQLPIGILAITRLGIVSVRQLRTWRRYAIVVNVIIAALLPGVDPVSLLLEFAIIHSLYELSVLVASLMSRGDAKRAALAGEQDAEIDQDPEFDLSGFGAPSDDEDD